MTDNTYSGTLKFKDVDFVRVHNLDRRTCTREINCVSSISSGAIIELKVAHRSHGIKELITEIVEQKLWKSR